MKFSFSNLGPITLGEIDLNKLTIICGKNNTGKTYINNAIYGYYETLYKLIANIIHNENVITIINDDYYINLEDIYNKIPIINEKVLSNYSKIIGSKVFKASTSTFNDFSMCNHLSYDCKKDFEDNFTILLYTYISNLNKEILITKEGYSYLIKSNSNFTSDLFIVMIEKVITSTIYTYIYKINFSTYFLPAERSGLSLLFRGLNSAHNDLLYNFDDLININNNFSPYSLSIKNYLNILNTAVSNTAEIKNDFIDIASALEKEVLGGKYIISGDNSILFNLHGKGNLNIDFHLSSSTARTLFGLDLFIKYIMSKGDLLIIDEPELNLHPDNQRKLARILAQLANNGIKLLISTHSDYIVKEFSNLIMLSRDFPSKNALINKYNYKNDETLSCNDINVYISKDNTLIKAPIETEGIIIDTFDEVLHCYNKSSDDIYYTYMEETNGEQ